MSSTSSDMINITAFLSQLHIPASTTSTSLETHNNEIIANIPHHNRGGRAVANARVFKDRVHNYLITHQNRVNLNPDAPIIVIFPSALTMNQRRIVHEVATSLGLMSLSIGEGASRQIRVLYRDDVIMPPSSLSSSSSSSSVSSMMVSESIDVQEGRRWSVEKAVEWYSAQPWLIGCNYIPSTAVNQLEMWQSETFDSVTIEREAILAHSLGFNVYRVYLHDLLWTSSIRDDIIANINTFLSIVDRYAIRVIFVLFDDCHRQEPIKLGPQPPPLRGIHNSGWLQSPGMDIVERINRKDHYQKEIKRLKEYVIGIITLYKDDSRVLMWDLYNEAGQQGLGNRSYELLCEAWHWAQRVRPSQPLTSCLDGSMGDANQRVNRMQSDVITFHWYHGSNLQLRIRQNISNAQGRPVICTEYMAREHGTTFQTSLPLFKLHHIGAISWGLVAGKTQTVFNWETAHQSCIETSRSLKQYLKPHESYPEPRSSWFHDIFRVDGSAYSDEEVEFIRNIAGVHPTR